MSYPPDSFGCDDPAVVRLRRRYIDIKSDIARVEAEAQRLQKEIDDRQRTLSATAGHLVGAAAELKLVSAWLRTADPEFPATT